MLARGVVLYGTASSRRSNYRHTGRSTGQLGRRSTTRCGIFGTDRRNSADPFVRERRAAENVSIFEIPAFSGLAQVLPLGTVSITCFEQLSFRLC
jgi:hypothetical protein